MATSLVPHVSKVRVSSVLNHDVKQFGKQFLFDGKEETCWNSDQGFPQFIHLEFSSALKLSEIHIQFQGGFADRESWVECNSCGADDQSLLTKIGAIYPQDISSLQMLTFNNSTDFFGRIVIYKLDLLGQLT